MSILVWVSKQWYYFALPIDSECLGDWSVYARCPKNILPKFSSISSSNGYILTIPQSAVRNERMLSVIQPLHLGFCCASWDWELFQKSQEHSVNASALVMLSHFQALEGFSLERCWYHLHHQRLSITAEVCGGWAIAAQSVGEEGFGLILRSMLHLVSLEKPSSPLVASSVFYCLNNELSQKLFSWSCLHLFVNPVNVRFFFRNFRKDLFTTTKLLQAKIVLPHTSDDAKYRPVCR